MKECIEEMCHDRLTEISRHYRSKYFSAPFLEDSNTLKIEVEDTTKDNLTVFHKIHRRGGILITTDEWRVDDGSVLQRTKKIDISRNAKSSSGDEYSESSDDDEKESHVQSQGNLSENDCLASMRLTAQYEDCKQHFRVFLRPGLIAKTLLDVTVSISDEIPLHYRANTNHFMRLLKFSAVGGRGEEEGRGALENASSSKSNKTSDFQEDETYERFENFLSSLQEEEPSMEGMLTGLFPIRNSNKRFVDGPSQHLGSRARRLFEAIKIRDASLLEILIQKLYNVDKYVEFEVAFFFVSF